MHVIEFSGYRTGNKQLSHRQQEPITSPTRDPSARHRRMAGRREGERKKKNKWAGPTGHIPHSLPAVRRSTAPPFALPRKTHRSTLHVTSPTNPIPGTLHGPWCSLAAPSARSLTGDPVNQLAWPPVVRVLEQTTAAARTYRFRFGRSSRGNKNRGLVGWLFSAKDSR